MPAITFYKHEPIPMEMHKVKIVQQLHLLPTEQRLQMMQEAGFNTFQLHNKDIFLDMLTDSGVNAMSDRQQAAMLQADDAYAGSETFYRMQAKLTELFGIEHCLPAHQGRACENILATRFVKPGSCVIMNYHFTTAKAHITRLGGRVEELVKKEGLESRSDLPFKGDIDLDALAACRRNGAWIDGALKQVLKREMPASVLLFGDWLVYLWAVQNGRVLECSLGYYIQPLVVFALGAIIFREKMNWRHFVIIAIVVVGIVFSTSGFGGVPYVTIALALMFSIYAAIKKSLTIDSIVSTTSEILMMVPVALLFILFFRMGDNGMGSMTVVKQLLMIGGGVITGLPMVFYSIGVRHLPLMTTGICQYISPSLSIICGAIMGEALTREKLVSFLFIWTGVLLYVLNTVYEEKQKKKAAVQ